MVGESPTDPPSAASHAASTAGKRHLRRISSSLTTNAADRLFWMEEVLGCFRPTNDFSFFISCGVYLGMESCFPSSQENYPPSKDNFDAVLSTRSAPLLAPSAEELRNIADFSRTIRGDVEGRIGRRVRGFVGSSTGSL
ncbi:hypothetical protein POX_e07117 [Penicillium oxalicum]|uniref:Uncharacterized protein n=1 Tax=Penicillium oxalicum (strain 114-2 / CGMCC 5302) TaxID=933388 RepID=S7ZD01_PENO1|nr:hypothetical protein POX_e07117 [Penicillium oxalicum]EPS28144.1 hypothetical protein PDE_03090 [Penicillium oxalicum 114-2]KAI2789090.1 hypothetical protein POX_e07117 [Penicillium oxalicum]